MSSQHAAAPSPASKQDGLLHLCLNGPQTPKSSVLPLQVVGVLCVFYWPAPILLKQGYLVLTGVVVAYVFTFIPEWTTWVLLLAMALYDLWAVLTPHGPLKVSVPRLKACSRHVWTEGAVSCHLAACCAVGRAFLQGECRLECSVPQGSCAAKPAC